MIIVVMAGISFRATSPGRCSSYSRYQCGSVFRTYPLKIGTHLIMYGIRDAAIHANAAQASKSPFPRETSIPRGTSVPLGNGTIHPLISCAFLMITVHMTAPMRSSTVANRENIVENRKPRACLISPLLGRVRF